MAVAHNTCCACGHEWSDYPGALATHESCPKCDSVYWVWANYACQETTLVI